jgi:hypothetical protein
LALSQGDWRQAIFQDKTSSQLTLSLFASGSITRQQNSTVLEYIQAIKNYSFNSFHQILEHDGQFTSVVKTELIHFINQRPHLRPLSKSQIEVFRLLIAALPKSE